MPDWNAIRAEYITTNISYRKLAEKAGVPFRTLADHARKESWAQGREKHRNSVVNKTVQKVAKKTAGDNAKKLLKLMEATDKIGEVLTDALDDPEQFKRHIITTGLGKGVTIVECRVEDKYDSKAIRDFTATLKDLAHTMRDLYELPGIKEKTAMDIAAERLALEREKVNADSEGAKDITVMLKGDTKGFNV